MMLIPLIAGGVMVGVVVSGLSCGVGIVDEPLTAKLESAVLHVTAIKTRILSHIDLLLTPNLRC